MRTQWTGFYMIGASAMKELMVPKAKNMFQVNSEKQETEVSRTTRQNFLRRYLKAIKVFSLKVPSPLFDTVLNRPLEKYVRDHLPIDFLILSEFKRIN